MNNNNPSIILDSSLISATLFKSQQSVCPYNVKVLRCNNYTQIYYFKNTKYRSIKNDDKCYDYDISKVDTDNLVNQKNETKIVDGLYIEERNINRSKLNCQRLAKCNSDDWQSFISLTFAENIKDINFTNKKFHNFVRQVQRVFKNFKYLCVPEFQKRGAVHYHILTNIPVNSDIIPLKKPLKLWNKELKKYKTIYYYDIKYWSFGFSEAEIVTGDIKKIVGYISKYMTKNIDNRLFCKHRFLYSQNLCKPKIDLLDLSNQKHYNYYIKLLEDKNLIYENEYFDEFSNQNIIFKEYLKE